MEEPKQQFKKVKMNLKTKILVLFLLVAFALQAQPKIHYSYVSDRKFTQPNELYGYTLSPNEWEDANGRKGKLYPGEVQFSIVRGYLKVKGGQAEGLYGINRIEQESKRIIRVSLLDAKDPANQGSLKVILDDNSYIDAYIFRRSRNSDEIIYYQKGLTARQKDFNKEFFTDENELVLAEDSDLWGKTIRPFFVLTRSSCNRIYPADSVSFRFIEDVVVKTKPEKEEKTDKVKIAIPKPDKKKGKKEEEELAKEDEFENEFEDEGNDNPFGFRVVKDDKPEKIEETTESTEEESTEEESTEIVEETTIDKPKAPKEKAPKEKRTYRMVYKYNVWVGDETDGYLDEKEEEMVVKKWKRLTSRASGDKDTRYVLEVTTGKGTVFVYMNERKAVSMIEIDGNRYLMRGY